MSESLVTEVLRKMLRRYAIQLTIGVVLFSIFSVWHINRNANHEIEIQRNKIMYIKEGYNLSTTIAIDGKRRQVNAFTSLIIGRYGKVYRKAKPQAMTTKEEELFNRNNIRYSELLGYGYYDLVGFSLLESRFNPYAVGTGSLKERTMFQITGWIVSDSKKFYEDLPKGLQKTFAFNDDLDDIHNVHKMVAVYWWGLNKKYANQKDWATLMFHFGESALYKWYKRGSFPDEFVYNEDDVHPVQEYFQTWWKIVYAFEHGRLEVQNELDYWTDIRKRMSLEEMQLTDTYKVIKKQRNLLKDVLEFDLEYNKGMKDYYSKIRKINKNSDKMYKRKFKNIKGGTWTKGMSLTKYMGKNADNLFKDFRNRVYKEDQWQFWTIFSIILIIMVLLFTVLNVLVYMYIQKK